MIAGLVFVGLIVPVEAANPNAPLMAATNTPIVSSPTGVSANSTLIPLTTAVARTGDTSAPLIITLQPAHPQTSTPPQTNTPRPSITGTPRPGMATVTRPAVSPAKGTPTRIGRSPTAAAAPAIIPVVPIVVTPTPTVATAPTPVPTATTAKAAPATTIAASPDASATAIPTEEMTATPTLIAGVDALPTVAVAARDLAPNEGQAPLASPTRTPVPLRAAGNLGMVVAFSLFVLVLGVVAIVSGIWGMVRTRRASRG